MQKIDAETKKAIIQIPKEINKLSKVVACVGKIMSNAETQKLARKKKDFQELLKDSSEKRQRSDVT